MRYRLSARTTLVFFLVATALVCFPISSVDARGGGAYGSYSTGTHGHPATGVPRDAHGKIQRSEKSRDDFKKLHPCPSTGRSSGSCPGYVIDHITSLKRGGADAPYNMQWQTQAAAKAKDTWE